jgi:uncharacterized membrane protein
MAFSKEYLVGLLAGVLSVVTAVLSAQLISAYKLNVSTDKAKGEKHTLYVLQQINGLFALVGLVILVYTIAKQMMAPA